MGGVFSFLSPLCRTFAGRVRRKGEQLKDEDECVFDEFVWNKLQVPALIAFKAHKHGSEAPGWPLPAFAWTIYHFRVINPFSLSTLLECFGGTM